MTPSSDSRKRVLIVGGGLAGLAAAVALTDDFAVTLFERRPALGGRASSFVDEETGAVVDNCQHVLMRCCANLLDFYRRLDVERLVRFHDTFRFIAPQGACFKLRGSPLPSPLHFAPAFARFGLLSLRERLGIVRAFAQLLTASPAHPLTRSSPFGVWLRAHGQSRRAIDLFWSPVIVSALNEDIERAAFRYARQVFAEGFLATRRSYEMGLPAVPLRELYDPALAFVEQRGGTVRLSTPIAGFTFDDGPTARMSDGSIARGDFVIAAVPFEALLRLLPDEVIDEHASFTNLRLLEHSPIVAVHLWFDREVTDLDHAALPGRTMQWMFNKSRNFSRPQAAAGDSAPLSASCPTDPSDQYLGFVVSAARGLIEKTRSEIIDIALRDVRDAFPRARDALVARAVVIKEPRATFSCTPESDALRPDQKTPIPGFYLAGDWTNTGWPATMEGAVISGYRCAAYIHACAGNRRKARQPGLVPDDAMRWD